MRVFIVGAGGAGKEVLGWLLDMNYDVAGFIDDNLEPVWGVESKYMVVATPVTFRPGPHDVCVMAIGEPTQRKKDIALRMMARGIKFITVVHPKALVPPLAVVGYGSVLYPGSAVATTGRVGDFVLMNVGAWVGHGAEVGDYCTLGPHAGVYGNAKVGEGSYLGGHAVILPNRTIGKYNMVGAGAVVTKDIDSGQTLVGVPARTL